MKVKIGTVVCDCKFQHLRITEIIDSDTVVLEDGSICSVKHCCDTVPHSWKHPEEEII
jgi:hypothetical protein